MLPVYTSQRLGCRVKRCFVEQTEHLPRVLQRDITQGEGWIAGVGAGGNQRLEVHAAKENTCETVVQETVKVRVLPEEHVVAIPCHGANDAAEKREAGVAVGVGGFEKRCLW